MIKKRKSVSLIGSAGVHYVCAELNMNGLLALPTVRNTKGMDVIVLTQSGELLANLQVKTSSRKVSFWPIGKHYQDWTGENDYYIFVRYYDERFEAYLESARNVIHQVKDKQRESRERKLAEWAPCWYLPKGKKAIIPKIQWRFFSRFHRLPNRRELTEMEASNKGKKSHNTRINSDRG